MGGYGALDIAFENPDVFSILFANAPGLLVDEDFGMAMEDWHRWFRKAYGSAFAAVDGEARIPEMDGSEEDAEIIRLWLSGFGNMEERIAHYLSLETRLDHIRIDYGSEDYYVWIQNGCEAFSDLLEDAGIEHDLVVQSRGHAMNEAIFGTQMLPYFAERFGD